MAFKDLQIQILEDVAAVCTLLVDFETHYSVQSMYSRDPLVTLKRPEGLLEQVAEYAVQDCSSVDVCKALGLPPQVGYLTSVGMALSKLGWKRHKTVKANGGAQWKWRK
jgi:hypothetical protein